MPETYARFHARFKRPLAFLRNAMSVHLIVSIGKSYSLTFPVQVV
jgi:hypothetical protein